MIIDCISDLHGHYPKLEGGDLLIIAGDLTARDIEEEYGNFLIWCIGRIQKQYKKLIFIPGNHDNYIYDTYKNGCIFNPKFPQISMLCDSGTEFEGLKIWGSPWTLAFYGINPKCKAFTCDTDEELAEKWKLIPNDIDILITHCPPYGILDKVERITLDEDHGHVGSPSLRNVLHRVKPKLWVFGHIHSCGGRSIDLCTTTLVNASQMNERYEPVNKPVRIIL